MPSEPSTAGTAELQPSGAFGQYQLVEKIAQGGMAEIFKGRALDAQGIERPVVIKRILPHIAASPEFVEMLVDEAKIAVMLSHGNIAQIYDLGKVADDYFIVMEYVEGKTLSQIMKRLKTQAKLMPIAYAAYCCREIAAALEYMHRKTDDDGNELHIVHRDISPQNAILSTAGTIKIIDFGIAKAKTKVSTTDSGVLKGKFAYMSPEHAEGLKLDHRTDVFSLGVILFELLTGTRLFKGKTNMETVKRVKKAKVPTPSGLRPSIPKVLDKIVFKALQKDREKRYASAHDLVQDLTRFLVTQYPDFSPREMVPYLQSLFPEIAPAERAPQEDTPLADKAFAPLKPPGGDWSSKEDTVNADSEVLRMKHKESEVFEVEGTQRTDSSSIGRDEVPVRRARTPFAFRLTPPVKTALIAVGVLLALGTAWGAVRYVVTQRQRAAEAQKPFPDALNQLKARQELLKKTGKTPTLPPLEAPATKETAKETKKDADDAPKTEAKTETKAEAKDKGKPSTGRGEGDKAKTEAKPAATEAAASKTGTITVDSKPQGARIFLNDIDTGRTTPYVFEGIPTGPRRVGLTLENYRFWEGQADVAGGGNARVQADLALNVGTLQVNSVPAGAEVIVNGRSAGKTPLVMDDLPPGTLYDVRVALEGFEDWKASAKVFGGRTEVVNAPLVKKTPSEE